MSTVKVNISENGSIHDIPSNLLELIKFFQDKLIEIPLEYQHDAEVDFDLSVHYDSPHCGMEISYRRPMTKQELEIEENRLREQKEKDRQWKINRIEMLKKELGEL